MGFDAYGALRHSGLNMVAELWHEPQDLRGRLREGRLPGEERLQDENEHLNTECSEEKDYDDIENVYARDWVSLSTTCSTRSTSTRMAITIVLIFMIYMSALYMNYIYNMIVLTIFAVLFLKCYYSIA